MNNGAEVEQGVGINGKGSDVGGVLGTQFRSPEMLKKRHSLKK